jgi:ABC-type glycerol-3-phosphate transport system substrate-binding protein
MARASGVSRRRFLVGAAALASGPLLAACQTAAPPAPTPEPKVVERVVTQVVEKPVEKVVEKVVTQVVVATAVPKAGAQPVRVILSTDWNAGARKDVMDKGKAEYERLNPNVKVEHWHLGAGGTSGPGGMADIVTAQLLTGTAADVIGEMTWQPLVEHFAEIGPTLRSVGWKPEEYVLTSEKGMDLNLQGKQYGVPYNSVVTGYYYNVDLFEKAGVKPPTEQWTFDDLFAASKALTKASEGIYGFHARDYWGWGWADFIWAEGARFFSDDGKKFMFAEGDAPDRFQWYVDLIYKHGVSPAPAEATKMLSPGVTEPFSSGKIGMMSGQTGTAGNLARQIGDRFRYAVMPTAKSPKTNKRAVMFNQGGLVVSKVARDRGLLDEAVKYAAFYNGDFVQRLYAELRPSMPASKKWLQSAEYGKPPPLNMGQFYKSLSGDDTIIINYTQGQKPAAEYWEGLQTAVKEISTAFTPENNARAKQIFVDAVAKGNQIVAKIP